MKELKFPQGGYPFTLDDITFLQDSIQEVFKAIGDGIGGADGSPVLVTGGEVTYPAPNQKSITDGWLYYVGLFYRIAASTVTGTAPYLVLVPQQAFPGSSKTTLANQTVFPYEEDFYILGEETVATNPFVIYLDKLVPFGSSFWQQVGTVNNPAFGTGWVNYYTIPNWYERVAFRKVNGRVYLRGTIQSNTTNWSYTLFTLPSGFRPQLRRVYPLLDVYGGNAHVIIQPDGQVILSGTSGQLNGVFFHLDGVEFELL